MTHCSGDLSTGVKVISSQEELEKVNNNLTYLFNHNHHQGDKENE
jgi:hypothetical protein